MVVGYLENALRVKSEREGFTSGRKRNWSEVLGGWFGSDWDTLILNPLWFINKQGHSEIKFIEI